jgi:hypothetical protein
MVPAFAWNAICWTGNGLWNESKRRGYPEELSNKRTRPADFGEAAFSSYISKII